MKLIFLLLFTLLIFTPSLSQEICDNGIDDDGDGFVDLNDTSECNCAGLLYFDSTFHSSIIPNPSFEEYTDCPVTFSEMDLLFDWEQPSFPTSDFIHSCGYIPGVVNAQALFPFPDGEGVAGGIYTHQWKEYIGTCLLDTLHAGQNYQLSMFVASSPSSQIGASCNDGVIYYSDVALTLFGQTSCSVFPFSGYQCPPAADGWIELGNVLYTPTANWEVVVIEFIPNVDITSVVLGPPCTLPSDYLETSFNPDACMPYFFYDKLSLTDQSGYYFNINSSYDQPCATNSVLSIESDAILNVGSWQWYYNGVAISGETSSELHLQNPSDSNGAYSVIYSDSLNCYGATYEVNYFHKTDTTFIEEASCGSYYWSSSNTTYYSSGTYSFIDQAINGCDSVIILTLTVNANVEEVYDEVICEGDTLFINGIGYFETGSYSQFPSISDGCINIYIEVVNQMTFPKIFFEPLECLGDSLVLKTEVEPIYNLNWTLPSGEVEMGDSIMIALGNSTLGAYELMEGGPSCVSGSDSVVLENQLIYSFETIVIPNVITLNNDGINDELLITGLPQGCLYELEIVNRWGERVYLQTETSSLFKGISLDDRILTQGIYFYVFRIGENRKSGFIQLIR